MQALLINSPVLQTLALTLIHFIWQGLLVAALVKVLLSVISPMRPQLRYGITSCAMVINLLLPILTFYYLYQPVVNSSTFQFSIIPIAEFQQVLQQTSSLAWYQQAHDYLPYLSIAWLAWVIFLTSRLLIDVAQVQRLPYKNIIETDAKLLARFDVLAKQIGLSRIPQLVISLKAEVPMAVGWLKPVVLMPAKMLMGLNQEQLEMLLLHELAHIRRYDYLVNFLQTMVEILLFFHPAVLWVSKQMRQEREYCSDDIAVSHCGNPVAYAHTLADTAELCTKHRHATIPAMAMAASGGDLKTRVYRIVNHSCTSDNDPGRWLAGLTIAIALFAVASKQFISMPFIDLTASLKLFNSSAQKSDYQATSNSLAEFSIAQQLLAPESISGKDKAPLVVVTEQLTNHVEQAQINETRTLPTKAEQAAKANKQANVQIANNSKQLPEQVNTPKNLTDQTNIGANTNRITDEPAIAKTALTQFDTETPGIIEQAITTKETNPYQQEIANLASEALAEPLSTENSLAQTAKHTSQPVSFNENVEPVYPRYASAVSLFEQRYNTVKEQTLNRPIKLSAKAIKVVDPKYPSVAKRKGIELEVLVNFTVGVDGRVSDIEFESQSRLNYFKSSITSAIKKWRFEPAKENGKPVQSNMSKIFSFNLA